MKNEKIINAWSKLDPDDSAKNRILDKIEDKQQKNQSVNKPILRFPLVLMSAAAVICFALAVYMILPLITGDTSKTPSDSIGVTANTPPVQDHISINPQQTHVENLFMVLAYSVEPQNDGSIELRELGDMLQEDFHLSDIKLRLSAVDFEDDIYYLSLGLVFVGENIKTIKIVVDEGFFGKSSVDDVIRHNKNRTSFILSLHSDYIEKIGNTVVLDVDDINNNLLLCWGMGGINDPNSLPPEITIHVEAIFEDGTTIGQIISLDPLSAFIDIKESIQRATEYLEKKDHFSSISPDEWELVSDSVKNVVDSYEYETGNPENPVIGIFSEDGFASWENAFDENGNHLIHWGDSYDDDDRGFIVILNRRSDGTLTGMIYRVPARAP